MTFKLKVDPYNACRADCEDLLVQVNAPTPSACLAIVRAVNHHETLVKTVRDLAFEPTDNSTGDMLRFGQAFNEAQKLLAEFDAAP